MGPGEPGGFALHQAVMIIPYYPVLRSAMSRSAARIWSRSASADSPVRVTGLLVPWRVA
jgi:hypothetical protein